MTEVLTNFHHHSVISILAVFVDGRWGSWDQWSTCTVTCDGGYQSRHRECDNPEPINGGSHCSVDGSIGSHSKPCNEEPCPSMNL